MKHINKGLVILLALSILIVGSGFDNMAWTSIVTNGVPWDLYNDPRAINNEIEIWNYFTNNGFTDEATAGIMGNMAAESFMNPGQIGLNMSMTNPYTSRGLIMWTTQLNIDRLYSVVGINTWMDGAAQCSYIESNPNDWVFYPDSTSIAQGFPYTWAQFKQLTDVYTASDAFYWEAERPGDGSQGKRQGFAVYFLQKFTGQYPPTPPPIPPQPPAPTPTPSNFLWLLGGRDVMRRLWFKK